MTELSSIPLPQDEDLTARDWVRTLAKYREPSTLRSSFELVVSAVPFLLLWALAWYCLSISRG